MTMIAVGSSDDFELMECCLFGAGSSFEYYVDYREEYLPYLHPDAIVNALNSVYFRYLFSF